MKYKLSKKNEQGKWWTYGSFAKNNYDKLQASFKVTPQLKELINSIPDGQWLNFAAFEEDKKEIKNTDKYANSEFAKNARHYEQKQNGYQPQDDLDDVVPF